MFDIMLDDSCLKGMTKDMKLLKDCSMTCNFLNAVICLYGNRYEEAIGYADMVLCRRTCLEAMFIKGRALYELKRNDEAYDVVYQIISISKDGEEKKAIDKKLLLFEARVNERIGNSVLPFAKQLISLCPEFLFSYIMIRKEVEASGVEIVFDPEEEHTDMLKAFVDKSISNWIRTFAVEDKPVLSSQVAVTDMKKDPDKEQLLQEIDRLKQELRLKSIDLKRTEMARDAYERMIVLAEERYGIPIRKKSDAK